MADDIDDLSIVLHVDGRQFEKNLADGLKKTQSHVAKLSAYLTDASRLLATSLQDQAATFGMSARSAEIHKLAMQGATKTQLEAARAADKLLTGLEREQAAFEQWAGVRDKAEAVNTAFARQAATFGMTARQIDIYNLKMMGAEKADIAAARAGDRYLTKLEKQAALTQRGKDVTAQFATAEERAAKAIRELDSLVQKGAISWQTYNRAAHQAKQELGTGWDKAAQAMQGLNNSTTQVGAGIQRLGTQLSMYLTAPLVGLGVLATREFSSFDEAAHKAFAIIKPESEQVKELLKQTATALSPHSSFNSAELMGGLKELAAAGFEARDAMASLPVVEKFATAGAFDLAMATRLGMDALSASGRMTKDATQNQKNLLDITDALAMAADQSTSDIKQLAEAYADAAGSAKMYGMGLNETVAILTAYANVGTKGKDASGQMERALLLTTNAVNEAKDTWKRYGIEGIDPVTGEMNSFISVLENVDKALKSLTGPEKVKALKDLGFDVRAQNAIKPLLDQTAAMRENLKAQQEHDGYTAKTASIQNQAFAAQWKMITHEIQNAGIAIGKDLAPYVLAVYKGIRDVSMSLKNWINDNKQLTATIIGVAVVVGPLITAIGTGIIVIGTMSAAWAALSTTMLATAGSATVAWLAVLGPVAAGVAVVGGLAVGVYALAGGFDQLAKDAEIWNAQLDRSIKLNEQIKASQTGHQNRVLTEANNLQGDERKDFLANKYEEARKNVIGYKNHIATLNAEIKSLDTIYNATFGRIAGNKDMELAQNQLKTMIEAEQSALKLMEDIQAAQNPDAGGKADGVAGAKGMTPDQEKAQGDIDDFVKATKKANEVLRLQAEAHDYSTNSAKLFALQVKGVTEEQLTEARAVHAANLALSEQETAAKKVADANKAFKDHNTELEGQVKFFGKSSREIAIYKAEMEGLAPTEIAAAKAMSAKLDVLEKNKKLEHEAAELTKKYQAPQEKFAHEQTKLKDMLDKGYITLETYNHGLKELQEEISKKYQLDFKTTGAEGMKKDSLQALIAMEDFQRRLSFLNGGTDSKVLKKSKKTLNNNQRLDFGLEMGPALFAGNAGGKAGAQGPFPEAQQGLQFAVKNAQKAGFETASNAKPWEIQAGANPKRDAADKLEGRDETREKAVLETLKEVALNTAKKATEITFKAVNLRGI